VLQRGECERARKCEQARDKESAGKGHVIVVRGGGERENKGMERAERVSSGKEREREREGERE